MIAEIFGYAIVVATLVGLAAASVEVLLAELRRPRRFAWLGAFVVAVALPPVASLLAPASPALVGGIEPAAPFATFDWDTTLLLAWLAATTALAVLYLAAWWRLALLAKRWSHATSDAVPVAVADDIGPAVLGILRPRIVLPRWLMDSPAAVRSTVVAHELEHIAARDQVCIVAAQLLTILLPWNLPLWWFARRLRAAIELDCDDRVLRGGVDAAEYADVLLTVGQRGSASAYVAATLIEPITQLERRIRIMLTTRNSVSAGRATAAAILIVASAACATRLEPPVVVAASTPAEMQGSVVSFESSGPDGVRIMEGDDGRVTVLARQILVRVGGPGQMRITSERIMTNGEDAVFEGDVRIDSDGTSISAERALAKTAPNGDVVLTVENAKVVRTIAQSSGE
jgi:bla regulator protein BlaR1